MGTIGGVELATARAGFYKHAREDLVVMRFASGTTCAGVFTRHGVRAACVDWCVDALAATGGQDIRALVVNAGCANAFTGAAGYEAARRSAAAVGALAGARPEQVLTASTGVIGVLLDAGKIEARMDDIAAGLAADRWPQAAAGIMTTDTFPKGATAETEIDGVTVRIAGIAKGSGMIAPDMATMLAFVATDAALSPKALQALLRRAIVHTFNAVTVDGDRSTNDSCLVFATGA
jgi:glutamate N-acetyltransferase/amino-acid N-acetyltransferase